MAKRSSLITAFAIGAIGVVALGACSSGSDQAESNREAAPASAEPSATATPTGAVLKASAKGNFKDVTVTYSGTAKCSSEDKGDKFEVNCRNVMQNFAGDQVFVRVPNHNFQINAHNFVYNSGKGTMQSTQRNGIYVEVARSHKDDVTWSAPPSNFDAWGVGVDGLYDPINVILTVTKG